MLKDGVRVSKYVDFSAIQVADKPKPEDRIFEPIVPIFHEISPQEIVKAEEERDTKWYIDHMVGLTNNEQDSTRRQRETALTFMKDHARKDIKEILDTNQSELIHRVWMERVVDKEHNLDGYYVWGTGLLRHKGVMPATPTLVGGYIDREEGEAWDQGFNHDKQKDPEKAYKDTKAKMEEWLLDRLANEDVSYLGQAEEPDPEIMRFGPDRAAHLVINGWTGNHLEFIEHMRSMVRGVGKQGASDKWIEKIQQDLEELDQKMGNTIPKARRERLLELLRNNPGQRDPRNHLFIGFGIMGYGTTPDEVYERPPNVADGEPYFNNNIQVQDVVDQPSYALEEFIAQLRKLQLEKNPTEPIEVVRANGEKITRNMIKHLGHVWVHSMGAHVGLRNLDPKSLFQKMMKSAGNNYFKMHVMNAVTYGQNVFTDKAELERINKLFYGKTLPGSTSFIDDTVLGMLVRYGADIMKPSLIRKLNRVVGVSARLTKYLLGSLKAVTPFAVHEDVNRNGPLQTKLNTRLCDEMPFFINNDEHWIEMQNMLPDGRLEIWSGSEPKPGDRILTNKSVQIQGEMLHHKAFVETHDHTVEPSELEKVASLIFGYIRGTNRGIDIDPYMMLKGFLPQIELNQLVKRVKFAESASVNTLTQPI